jgi:hypothetical protein
MSTSAKTNQKDTESSKKYDPYYYYISGPARIVDGEIPAHVSYKDQKNKIIKAIQSMKNSKGEGISAIQIIGDPESICLTLKMAMEKLKNPVYVSQAIPEGFMWFLSM